MGLAIVPEAVISPDAGVGKVSVYPALILKVTPPGPTPPAFSAVIAAAMEGKSPGIALMPVSCAKLIVVTRKLKRTTVNDLFMGSVFLLVYFVQRY